jgi:Flp pilus assembly protein protease CpaA
MYKPFFPDPAFGWAFFAVLTGLLAVAAYVDWRSAIVPKKLTLSALALGVLFNLVRGCWLGASGAEGWALGQHGALVGLLDGLLFSLAGFLAGFTLFFILWILGACGGGDVKLLAALGAWVGGYLVFWVLAGTVAVVFVLAIGHVVLGLVRGRAPVLAGQRKQVNRRAGKSPRRKQLLTYSLPVAVVATLVLLWSLRVDLHLAPPTADKGETHAIREP